MGATPRVIDFKDVSDGGGRFNKKHQDEGEYIATVIKVEDAPSKKDGVDQWLYTIQVGSGTYPYYCKLDLKSYWKIKNLLKAAGLNVPPKKVNVDPNVLVDKKIGISLQDTEWNDKIQSEIGAVLSIAQVKANAAAQGEVVEEEEEEEEEDEDEAPKPVKKAKAKAAPTPAVDDDELEELEIDTL